MGEQSAWVSLQVLDALDRETYDVVIMDVQMPEMDGLETTRQIRQRWSAGRRPHVIAATASAMIANVGRGVLTKKV